MKKISVLIFSACILIPVLCFAAKDKDEAVLIAASATSYSTDSSPIICLLEKGCKGYWSPKSGDAGENEGIYLQFKNPVLIDYIEVTVAGIVEGKVSLKVYLDGKTITKAPEYQGDSDARSIDTNSFTRGENTVFLIGADYSEKRPLNYKAKSVFIKVDRSESETATKPPKIKSIRFFNTNDYNEGEGTPIKVGLPIAVDVDVAADSTLSPVFAYDVSHLFDSQPDMAWSTDGKITDGIGQKIKFKFETNQSIKGLMIWNGYQRSSTHFTANSRVKSISINGVELEVKDKQGYQTVTFDKSIEGVEIVLEIKSVYPGSKYRDMLISELRFLSPEGRIILPRCSSVEVPVPEVLEGIVDNTYAAFLQGLSYSSSKGGETIYREEPCDNSTMRLRSNGTFVIYKNAKRNASAWTADVVEGNWEMKKDNTVRLFGKKYMTFLESKTSGYLGEEDNIKVPAPQIFQSDLQIQRFNELSKIEQDKIIYFLLRKTPDSVFDANIGTTIINVENSNEIGFSFSGDNLILAVAGLRAKLKTLNPVYVNSDVYTNLVLPYSVVRYCWEYY